MIFNAQKTKGYSDITGDLTFDQVDINIGNGFDGSSGIFKVPVSGIYHLSFSGQSANKNTVTAIYVYKNGLPMFRIYDTNEVENSNAHNVSYTWMMTLVQGDELKLNSHHYLLANSDERLTFTGELIHIEN